jgi:hypothetical protein
MSIALSGRPGVLARTAVLALALAALPLQAQQLVESFADVPALFSGNWVQVNRSSPAPDEATALNGFAQGFAPYFAAEGSAAEQYAQVSWRSTSSLLSGTISNWMITPVLNLFNGMEVTFHTRTFTSPHADRRSTDEHERGPHERRLVADRRRRFHDVAPGRESTLSAASSDDLDPADGYGQVLLRRRPADGVPVLRDWRRGGQWPDSANYVGIDTLTVMPVSLQNFSVE